MDFNVGENIQFKLLQGMVRHDATVISIDTDNILLQSNTTTPEKISQGQHLIIMGGDSEYYTEVIDIKRDTIKLKQMWSERRGYFRVDDILPVCSKKVKGESSFKKSKVFQDDDAEYYTVDPVPDTPTDGTTNPQLWKMLTDINVKLGLILKRINPGNGGIIKIDNRQVDISASGIRFTADEDINIGDIVEVKLFLPTSPPTGILTYGNVVRSKELGNGQHEVALHFKDMDDETRDRIIQYAIKRQREIINKERGRKN